MNKINDKELETRLKDLRELIKGEIKPGKEGLNLTKLKEIFGAENFDENDKFIMPQAGPKEYFVKNEIDHEKFEAGLNSLVD